MKTKLWIIGATVVILTIAILTHLAIQKGEPSVPSGPPSLKTMTKSAFKDAPQNDFLEEKLASLGPAGAGDLVVIEAKFYRVEWATVDTEPTLADAKAQVTAGKRSSWRSRFWWRMSAGPRFSKMDSRSTRRHDTIR